MTTDTALSPCPFCGGTDAQAWNACGWEIDCACGINFCPQDTHGNSLSLPDTIAAWNRRASLAQAPVEAKYLFIAMDDDGRAHPTFCADEIAVERAVQSAMYSLSPAGAGLSAAEIETVEATTEELMEDGYVGFEGDPPLHLYKLGKLAAAPAPAPEAEQWLEEALEKKSLLIHTLLRSQTTGSVDAFNAADNDLDAHLRLRPQAQADERLLRFAKALTAIAHTTNHCGAEYTALSETAAAVLEEVLPEACEVEGVGCGVTIQHEPAQVAAMFAHPAAQAVAPKDEPVAWMAEDGSGYRGLTFIDPQTAEGACDGFTITPLYTHPTVQAQLTPPLEIIGWQWRRTGSEWPEKMLSVEPVLTAPDTEVRAVYAGAPVTYGVPEFDLSQPCALTPHSNPILTQCPRCKNPHHKCDNGNPGVDTSDGGQRNG